MSTGFDTCKCKVKYSRQPCLFFNDTKNLKYFSVTRNKYVSFFPPKRQICNASSRQVTCPQAIVSCFPLLFFFLVNSYFTSQTICTTTFMKILGGMFSIYQVCFSLLSDFFFSPIHPVALISILKCSLFFLTRIFALKLVLANNIRIQMEKIKKTHILFLFKERGAVNLFWSLFNIWSSSDKEYASMVIQSKQELLKCHTIIWLIRDNK